MLLLALGLLPLVASAVVTADHEPPAAHTTAGGGGTPPTTPPPQPPLEAAEQRLQETTLTSQPPDVATDAAVGNWTHADVATLGANDSTSWDPATTTTAATTLPATTTRAPHVHDHGHVHVHGPGDSRRYGPYFEDGPGPHNVTARVGQTALLDCRVGLLQGKTVSWLHHRQGSLQLLTVGRHEYSADQRITLSFRYPGNWRLRIQYVTRRDQGLYECQVATHPPRALRIYLTVTAPDLVVTDDKGHLVSERYYKAGSAVELTCVASRLEGPEEVVTWRHGDQLVVDGVSTNASESLDAVQSTLTIERAQKKHSGNYTCAAGDAAAATVMVHVLNGQLPAAVQHNQAAEPPDPPMLLMMLMLLQLTMTATAECR